MSPIFSPTDPAPSCDEVAPEDEEALLDGLFPDPFDDDGEEAEVIDWLRKNVWTPPKPMARSGPEPKRTLPLPCATCEAKPRRSKLNMECNTCSEYRRTHDGKTRPVTLTSRQADLNARRNFQGYPAIIEQHSEYVDRLVTQLRHDENRAIDELGPPDDDHGVYEQRRQDALSQVRDVWTLTFPPDLVREVRRRRTKLQKESQE